VCDTVAILDRGRIVANSSIDELKKRYGKQRVVVQVTEGSDALAASIARLHWAQTVTRGTQGEIEVTVSDIAAARHQIPALVARQQTGITMMEAGEFGLEEVFVELVGQARP